jgi:hypothetical protein
LTADYFNIPEEEIKQLQSARVPLSPRPTRPRRNRGSASR